MASDEYVIKVAVYNDGSPKNVSIMNLKVGDILQTYDGHMVTVDGAVYDDGIDYMIPVKYNNGNVEHLSPLLVL